MSITAGELAQMQADQHTALDLTCTIRRYARGAKDTTGGNSPDTWTPDGTTTHVRLGDARGEELTMMSKQLSTEHATNIATFAVGATAENAPPKLHDLLNASDGHTYDVITDVINPSNQTAQRFGVRQVS